MDSDSEAAIHEWLISHHRTSDTPALAWEGLHGQPIPCRAERYTAKGGPDTWWPTPEPAHRINQIFLEPVLFAHAVATSRLSILNRTRVVDYVQSESGVRATAENLDNGGVSEIFATYLIGCDGAHSDVRHIVGAKFSGDAAVMQTQLTYIRTPKLLGMISRPAWLNVSLNRRCSGYLFAIDGRERWLIHNWRSPSEDLATLDRDRCIREILGVESTFEFDILGQEDWTGRRMIADRFRDRRVFLCGDAAHIWVPFAGYGMNAGIADAMNLSWKLAGVLKGWAEPGILDAYELERQPVTEQVSRYAMNISCGYHKVARSPITWRRPDQRATRHESASAGRYTKLMSARPAVAALTSVISMTPAHHCLRWRGGARIQHV